MQIFRQDRYVAALVRPNELSVEVAPRLWDTQGLEAAAPGLYPFTAEAFQFGYLTAEPIRVKEVEHGHAAGAV